MNGAQAGEQQLSPQVIREKSQAWFDRQVEILAKAHGSSWPANREWVESYLKEELRQRLVALGWAKK